MRPSEVTWPIEICEVCEEPVSLFDCRGFMTVGNEQYVHHMEGSEKRTCFEKVLDAYARLWENTASDPYMVNGKPWIPEVTRAITFAEEEEP